LKERKMTEQPPSDLFEQVLHAIEGEEIERRVMQLKDGVEKTVELRYCGPDTWITRVHERGILTPLEFLAIAHFALHDFRHPGQDERRIVDGWYRAIIIAAEKRAIVPRDRDSLLPLESIDGWNDWVLSVPDADSFVASVGMEWSCTEVAAHLYQECTPPHVHLLKACEELGVFARHDSAKDAASTGQDAANSEAGTTDDYPAVTPAHGADSQPLAGVDVAPATGVDWIVRARELAQAIGEEIWSVGVREVTVRGLSDRVATELGKERRYHGTRGPRSASNVRSEALKGWKFAPPDEVA
jgi:hypothetical protein